MSFHGADDEKTQAHKKRLILFGVSVLMVVAMTISLGFGARPTKNKPHGQPFLAVHKNVTKADVVKVCSVTEYNEACMRLITPILVGPPTPRDVMNTAFIATILSINKMMSNMTQQFRTSNDSKIINALNVCNELMGRASYVLRNTVDRVDGLDYDNFIDFVDDLRTWTSSALTCHVTCINTFHELAPAAAETAAEILETSREMTSNSLAIATNIRSVFEKFDLKLPRFEESYDDDTRVDEHEVESVEPSLSVSTESRRGLSSTSDDSEEDAKVANFVVAKDGPVGGKRFRTINAALQEVPKGNTKRLVIHIKEGVYEENVNVSLGMEQIAFVGDGPTKTRIVGSRSLALSGINTYHTATVAIEADWFMAQDITFENTAGPKGHQAVALRVAADFAMFYNCDILGYQNTLYVHDRRQYFHTCRIAGTIDFIFGDARAFFQKCDFIIRKPMDNQQCTITAQERTNPEEPTGIIIQKSRIIGSEDYIPVKARNKAYLGRPAKKYSKTVVIDTTIDDVIDPEGWLKWNQTFGLGTSFFAEYKNVGPGSVQDRRVRWPAIKKLKDKDVGLYNPAVYLGGERWRTHFDAVVTTPTENPNQTKPNSTGSGSVQV